MPHGHSAIGPHASLDIVLPDATVSNRHASIERGGGRVVFELCSLTSETAHGGTEKSGTVLRQSPALRAMDQIQLGYVATHPVDRPSCRRCSWDGARPWPVVLALGRACAGCARAARRVGAVCGSGGACTSEVVRALRQLAATARRQPGFRRLAAQAAAESSSGRLDHAAASLHQSTGTAAPPSPKACCARRTRVLTMRGDRCTVSDGEAT